MPSTNKFRHYDLSQSSRKVLNVASFGGVDLSSQRFNVATNRAIEAKNFIYRDGVIQTRHGYEQVAQLEPTTYVKRDFETNTASGSAKVNGVNFNGIWRFDAEDGNSHIIAHIGNLLYEATEDLTSFEPISSDSLTSGGYPVLYEYEDFKSFAFVGAKKLWFLGGNKYMVIRFTESGNTIVEPVDSSDYTFIPTTSIAITYKNALVSSRSLLDYPNALTVYRYNNLLSGIGMDENSQIQTDYFEYTLDAPLTTSETENDIEALSVSKSFSSLSDETKEKIANISVTITHMGVI